MIDGLEVIVFTLVIIGIAVVMFTWAFWDAITDPDYKSRGDLIGEEKDKVRKLSCGDLKDYILLSYDGEWRNYYQGSFAKELFVWKCEK